MWHNLKFVISQLFIFIIGIYLLFLLKAGLIITMFTTVILSVIYIQAAKIFEFQADTYAAKNMDNPNGMITGNIKMKEADKGFLSNPIMKHLLTIAVPYEERIKIARKQLYFKKIIAV